MNKFALRAASITGVVAVVGCGAPSSQLSGTSWTSATIAAAAAPSGLAMSTYVVHFGAAASSTQTAATGPFTATLTEAYSMTASTRAGCTDITALSGGTYVDTFSQSNDLMGMVTISGASVSVVSMNCVNPAQNGTFTMEPINALPSTGGSDTYAISGTMMVLTGTSALPYAGTSYMFTSM